MSDEVVIDYENKTIIVMGRVYPPTGYNLELIKKSRLEKDIDDRIDIYERLSEAVIDF